VAFDRRTGERRFEARTGAATPLGPDGDLLFVAAPAHWEVIRTRDGARVGQWDASAAPGGIMNVRPSPDGLAIAVVRSSSADAARINAEVYAVRRNDLVATGYAPAIPARTSGRHSLALLEVGDDARSIRVGDQVWFVSGKRDAEASRPSTGSPPNSSVSPRGRFEMRATSTALEEKTTFTIVRRADQSVVEQFVGAGLSHRFSSDDRWLAVWSEGLQLLDLERGEMVLRFKPTVGVDAVEFAAGNTLLSVHLEDQTTTFIPVERQLLERFARWLAPRPLTAEEACLHGLGGDDCWKAVTAVRRRTAASNDDGTEGRVSRPR
jgi:hypothetical protein